MKGLKTLLVFGLAFFSFNASGLKLEIVKKSTSIAHETIDSAEVESLNAESSLKDTLSENQIDEDGFDTIKSKVKSNRKAASKKTYSKIKTAKIKDDFESHSIKAKKKVELPKNDSITTEEAVRNIDSKIKNEFSDEIGLEEIANDEDNFAGLVH